MNINKLCGGENIHQSSPKVVQMRLHSGKLSKNNEENVSVFETHFCKVLNNTKVIDDTVLNDIDLKVFTMELNGPPKWA